MRYDAYEDKAGQSSAFALLDSARTSVVVSAIQGRDYARIYMKARPRPSVDRAVAGGARGRGAGHGPHDCHPKVANPLARIRDARNP